MSPDPFTNLDPAQTVKVLPRHLAGPGPIDLPTAWPFPFDEDWSLHQPQEGTAYAISPCLRLWTRLAPDPGKWGKPTWTLGASRVPFGRTTWQITFDATTPIELLHDVHAELLDLYLEDRHSEHDRLFEDATPPHEAYASLLARGWSHDVKTYGTQIFLAPEGLGGVQHQYAISSTGGPVWRAWGGRLSDPYWQARFSSGTPTTLVAAFTASLISTEAVHRTARDVPSHTRQHLYVATTAVKQPPSYSPAVPPPAAPAAGRTR